MCPQCVAVEPELQSCLLGLIRDLVTQAGVLRCRLRPAGEVCRCPGGGGGGGVAHCSPGPRSSGGHRERACYRLQAVLMRAAAAAPPWGPVHLPSLWWWPERGGGRGAARRPHLGCTLPPSPPTLAAHDCLFSSRAPPLTSTRPLLPSPPPRPVLSWWPVTSPQRVQQAACLPGSPALLRAPLLWPGPARRPSRGLPK